MKCSRRLLVLVAAAFPFITAAQKGNSATAISADPCRTVLVVGEALQKEGYYAVNSSELSAALESKKVLKIAYSNDESTAAILSVTPLRTSDSNQYRYVNDLHLTLVDPTTGHVNRSFVVKKAFDNLEYGPISINYSADGKSVYVITSHPLVESTEKPRSQILQILVYDTQTGLRIDTQEMIFPVKYHFSAKKYFNNEYLILGLAEGKHSSERGHYSVHSILVVNTRTGLRSLIEGEPLGANTEVRDFSISEDGKSLLAMYTKNRYPFYGLWQNGAFQRELESPQRERPWHNDLIRFDVAEGKNISVVTHDTEGRVYGLEWNFNSGELDKLERLLTIPNTYNQYSLYGRDDYYSPALKSAIVIGISGRSPVPSDWHFSPEVQIWKRP